MKPTDAMVEAAVIEAALLQVTYQSFDTGGESARSLRSRALELVLARMIEGIGHEAFPAEKSRMEADPFTYVQEAPFRLTALLSHPDAQPVSREEVARIIAPEDFANIGNTTLREEFGRGQRARDIALSKADAILALLTRKAP